MTQGIQQSVGTQPAVAVAGDFASANPRYSVDAGPGGLVAGPSGLTAGLFAWVSFAVMDGDGAPAAANNYGSGKPAGIAPRNQQGLITSYLNDASMVLPFGFQATVISSGDMWIVNNGATAATPGMKAYANFGNGQATFAATGAGTTASGSASSVAAAASSFTGSIAGNIMTVTAVASGNIVPGTTISGTGVTTGTKIAYQLSGTPNGVGTYALDTGGQNVTSETITGAYGILTVGGTVVAGFGVGDTISGTNVVTGTKITALISGTGAGGTYAVDNATVVTSTAITAATNVETDWWCSSYGLPGELVKVQRTPALG